MAFNRNSEASDRLRVSLDRTFKFLKDSRNPDGFWSDFLTLAGESVYWVSGYVGYNIICYLKDPEEKMWLEKVGYGILAHQSADGGWGYGFGVPSDGDSTSWCLRFLAKLGIQSQLSLENASSFLLKHQSAVDGGFRTYANPSHVGRYMMLDGSVSFEGWASSQMCVTAVATQALIENGSTQGVEKASRLYSEEDKWLKATGILTGGAGKLYATVNCMEALKVAGDDNANILDRLRIGLQKRSCRTGAGAIRPNQWKVGLFQLHLH